MAEEGFEEFTEYLRKPRGARTGSRSRRSSTSSRSRSRSRGSRSGSRGSRSRSRSPRPQRRSVSTGTRKVQFGKEKTKKGTQRGTKKSTREASKKRSQKASQTKKSPKHGGRKQTVGQRTLYVLNPNTFRLLEVGKPTYLRLMRDGVLDKDSPEYDVETSVARWTDVQPRKPERMTMYDKHKDMFMLPPHWDLPKAQQHLNKDDWAKYPIATATRPGVPVCQGIKAALVRLSLNKTFFHDRELHDYVFCNIMRALHTHCAKPRFASEQSLVKLMRKLGVVCPR